MELVLVGNGSEVHQGGEGRIACPVIQRDISHVLQTDNRRLGGDVKGVGDLGDQFGSADRILAQRIIGVFAGHKLHRTLGHEDG